MAITLLRVLLRSPYEPPGRVSGEGGVGQGDRV